VTKVDEDGKVMIENEYASSALKGMQGEIEALKEPI
jgi:hypothetical protein